jgi:type II secretory pathway pseudopilin PulG
LQIIIVIAVIALLAAVMMPTLGRSREAAKRAQCDMRLKTIALALDAYRQEHGRYPKHLQELRDAHYIQDPDALRCPDDPRPANEGSYDDYYVLRSARDANELPILVCPFHEETGGGAQAYKGRYTTQLAARPAHIINARDVTVQRPGKSPIAASAGMAVRGGDRITTGGSGGAVIEFSDGSRASLEGGADLTVLQSFVLTNAGAPLYTIVRQTLGQVTYTVNHGSPFDVATPTATAGARGTEFTVTVNPDGTTDVVVTSGKVLFTTLDSTVPAPLNKTVKGLLNGLINIF